MRPATQRLAGEDGQALVEFAIVATVLLFIVIGILYFGRFFNYMLDQTHLANVGARYAAVGQNPGCPPSGTCSYSTLAQYVQSLTEPGELQSGSTDVPQKATVCIKLPAGSSGSQGDPVEVDVTAKYHFLPFLKVTDITVTETATMRLETSIAGNTAILGPAGC
jgi:Flp pilus assembly protein TadG